MFQLKIEILKIKKKTYYNGNIKIIRDYSQIVSIQSSIFLFKISILHSTVLEKRKIKKGYINKLMAAIKIRTPTRHLKTKIRFMVFQQNSYNSLSSQNVFKFL